MRRGDWGWFGMMGGADARRGGWFSRRAGGRNIRRRGRVGLTLVVVVFCVWLDPTFTLVKRATYRLVDEFLPEQAVVAKGETNGGERGRKRAAPSESAASDQSEKSSQRLVDFAVLKYERGTEVEVARPHDVHGATWASATILDIGDDYVSLRVAPAGGEETPKDEERLPLSALSNTIRPLPPVQSLAVDNTLRLNEEVDVHYNNRWCEGYVSQVTDARGKLVVCFPGVGVNNDTSLIVFQDSTGQSWIRETWNKTRPKRASIRRGWSLSSITGKWSPRGAPHETGGPDSAYKHIAALVSASEAGDSTKRYKSSMPMPMSPVRYHVKTGPTTTTATTGTAKTAMGDSATPCGGGGATSDEIDCPFKSISEACYHLLLNAGPAGLQVSEMVKIIQERSLVKLAGRTPSNTLYSRLSQDGRFINVSRGAYALVSVVDEATKRTILGTPGQFDDSLTADSRMRYVSSKAMHTQSSDGQHSYDVTVGAGVGGYTAAAAGFASVSATPSVAGDYNTTATTTTTTTKSSMSELSDASELLLGLRRGRR